MIGPLLFLIFGNDAPQYVKAKAMNLVLSLFIMFLFADDVLFVVCNKDLTRLEMDVFILLNIFRQWADLNFFEFNVDKTKYMLLGTKNIVSSFNILIDNQEIEMVSMLKYLGILLDEKLKFIAI